MKPDPEAIARFEPLFRPARGGRAILDQLDKGQGVDLLRIARSSHASLDERLDAASRFLQVIHADTEPRNKQELEEYVSETRRELETEELRLKGHMSSHTSPARPVSIRYSHGKWRSDVVAAVWPDDEMAIDTWTGMLQRFSPYEASLLVEDKPELLGKVQGGRAMIWDSERRAALKALPEALEELKQISSLASTKSMIEKRIDALRLDLREPEEGFARLYSGRIVAIMDGVGAADVASMDRLEEGLVKQKAVEWALERESDPVGALAQAWFRSKDSGDEIAPVGGVMTRQQARWFGEAQELAAIVAADETLSAKAERVGYGPVVAWCLDPDLTPPDADAPRHGQPGQTQERNPDQPGKA